MDGVDEFGSDARALAAEAMERRHARRVGLLKKETARAERLGNEQARAAEANNKGAVTRMMATTATTLRVLADINAQKAMDHAERVEQVLELKAKESEGFMESARCTRQNKLEISAKTRCLTPSKINKHITV